MKGATALETSLWCQMKNGTFLPLGYAFVHQQCSVCQCLQSRLIQCKSMQCMQTYCIDDSLATREPAQCCATCSYETNPKSCPYKNILVPHGVLIQQTSANMYCWCQSGTIECRKFPTTTVTNSFWGANSTLYIIIIVICVVLLVGAVVCISSCIVFNAIFKKRKEESQAIQEQYINNIGWQPVQEETVKEAPVNPYVIYNGQVVADKA